MITGDHDNPGLGQHLPQPLELQKGVEYRRIRRPHGVKNIAGNQHQLWPQLDHLVNYALQRPGDIVLPLVQSRRSLSLILLEAEMYVS